MVPEDSQKLIELAQRPLHEMSPKFNKQKNSKESRGYYQRRPEFSIEPSRDFDRVAS